MTTTKDKLKEEFFRLLRILEGLKNSDECVIKRDILIAITELETSQMWAVRSLREQNP